MDAEAGGKEPAMFKEAAMKRPFHRGDLVVLRVFGHATHPVDGAKAVYPSPCGEDYSYYLDAVATIEEVTPEGKILLLADDGAWHSVDSQSPAVRHATWWERLMCLVLGHAPHQLRPAA
jgi:hypothetical protein